MKRKWNIILSGLMLCTSVTACTPKKSGYQKNKELASAADVTLKLTGMTASFKAMESVISSFQQIYPNCTIEYEYVQDYDKSMKTRLDNNDDVDLFVTYNITADSQYLPYAMELSSQSGKLDLSQTYDGLIRNFTLPGDNGGLYAVPLGGEVRGMYVNTTLLSSLDLTVPTNYSELMDCCQKLLAAGYIPLQGNPGTFGVLLMYPYICNLIANAADYQTVYDRVNRCESGISELFREPFSRLYHMVAEGYYNYKLIETKNHAFMENTDDVIAKSFLNIAADAGGNEQKTDDVGQVAFMPGTMSQKNYLDKTKDNYHSEIEYQFILSPVGDDGGYAYLSPAAGIAINKNSSKTAWALEFLNYLFSKEVNQSFAEMQNIIPNTADALDIINRTFQVDSGHVCQLGQVSFDYVFYDVIKKSLTEVSKGNNPKYMKSDGTMHDLNEYMDALETALAKNRS